MSKFGVPTEQQLAKINKLAKRTLSQDEVFVFPGKLAGDMIIPDRYVQLSKELLQVFLTNAQRGVSLLLDHSWHADGFFGMGGRPRAAIPYGRTFDASLGNSSVEGETVELNADHYIVRGMSIDGVSTDDLITGIEAGTLFDSSIGFNYNTGICSVCGANYFKGSECSHYAGKTYEVEIDGIAKNVLCYIKAQPPGALWENSLVFDGAYPTAGVLSKGDVLENESGIYEVITEFKDVDPAKQIIATYGQRTGLLTMVKKSDHKKIYAMKGGEKPMSEKLRKMLEDFGIAFKEGEPKPEEVMSQIAEKWDSTIQSIKDSATPFTQLESTTEFMTKESVTEKLGKELSADEVLKLAKEGQDYHKQVIDNAIAMGVRAQGNDFPAETWRTTFSTMGTSAIKDIMKTFEAQANAEIPTGRLTNPETGQKQSQSIPEEMFQVGR